MPPLKRTATGPPASPAPKRVRATPLKGERSSREPAEGNETPTDTRASRGIRTRRQLLENPDSESGSSDAEDEGTDEEEHIESKNDCDRFLVEFDPEHLAQCVAQARAEVKSFLSAPHPGDAKTRQALNGLFSDVIRGESNSVMLLGPHGSGKTSVSRPFLMSEPKVINEIGSLWIRQLMLPLLKLPHKSLYMWCAYTRLCTRTTRLLCAN